MLLLSVATMRMLWARKSHPGHMLYHRYPATLLITGRRPYATFVFTLCRCGCARTDSTPTPEDSTMSIAPLSARLFHFLGVVAFAPFIVLMLGTGSYADPATSLSWSPAYSSKSLRTQFSPSHPFAVTPVQFDCRRCRELYFQAYMQRCNATDHNCVMAAHLYACTSCRRACPDPRC